MTQIGSSPELVGGGTEINTGVVGGGTTEKNVQGAHFAGGIHTISDTCRQLVSLFKAHFITNVPSNDLERLHESFRSLIFKCLG